ncbi:hypothetical protein F2P56_030148 [Juglans regia]|uniref:DUF569 domain-containing protein n=1 Tax=Juglans regia TaxID=51240 RepID=A0A833SZ04_JUGRE|nr:hypothetical protein F2P56_030148 [Juglans regia]
MTGYKVLQTEPDEGYYWKYEWEPIRDGFQVKLRTWCGKYLRANGGTPPWRNSITHDDPHSSSTQNWILWDVEPVESVSVLMSSRSSLSSLSDEVYGSEPESPMSVISTASSRFSSKQVSLLFFLAGNGVDELTRKLEEETGLEGIIVCNRFNGKLYPLRLQLPPNNASMNVIVVLSSSKVPYWWGMKEEQDPTPIKGGSDFLIKCTKL